MKLECDERGDFLVDHAILTAKLSISADKLRHHMRLGLVTSIVETGIGIDEGHRRLTVRCGKAVWRAVLDADQNVLSEETFSLRPPGRGKVLR